MTKHYSQEQIKLHIHGVKRERMSCEQHWMLKFILSHNCDLSTGSIYALGSTESVYGWIFAKFLNGLRDFIEEKKSDKYKGWLIILDNVPNHHSKLETDYINRQKLCVAFIHAYSPDLVPIEKYFALLKIIVSNEASKTRIN